MIRKFQTHFYVRTTRKDPAEAELSIRSRVNIGRYADFHLLTGLSIQSRFWDPRKERPKTYVGNNPALAEYLRRTDDKLSRLEYEFKLCIATHEDVTKAMLQGIIDNVIDEDAIKSRGIPTGLSAYCAYVIKQMIDGSRLASRKSGGLHTYGDKTIRGWKTFQSILTDFDGDRLFWDRITAQELGRFAPWLASRGLLPGTQNIQIAKLRTLAAMAHKDGILKDLDVCDSLQMMSTKGPGSKRTNIYLTEPEIEALYNMPLEPGSLRDQVRDVFCMGCFICQRVSDYGHLEKAMFTTTGTGTPVIKLTQQKTGQKVSIPLSLSPHILELAEKYDYNMPTVKSTAFNTNIKQICRELAETVPSLNEKVPTVLTRHQRAKEEKTGKGWEKDWKGQSLVPRWNLVESHTARRSGITNLYMSGRLTDAQIMSISGHATQKNFELYHLEGPDFVADKIDEKFKDTTL